MEPTNIGPRCWGPCQAIRSRTTMLPRGRHGQRTRGSLPDVALAKTPLGRGRLLALGSCNKEAGFPWASAVQHVLPHSAAIRPPPPTRIAGMSVRTKARQCNLQLADLCRLEGITTEICRAPGLRASAPLINWALSEQHFRRDHQLVCHCFNNSIREWALSAGPDHLQGQSPGSSLRLRPYTHFRAGDMELVSSNNRTDRAPACFTASQPRRHGETLPH